MDVRWVIRGLSSGPPRGFVSMSTNVSSKRLKFPLKLQNVNYFTLF